MLGHWTIFEGTPGGVKREQRRITLGMNKTISLNKVAYEELGKPIAIELRFDRNLKRIGLKATSPECKNAFPIRPKKNSHYRWLAAGAFLTHFGITTQCTVQFEDVTIDSEGVMVLDINKTTNISRGSR